MTTTYPNVTMHDFEKTPSEFRRDGFKKFEDAMVPTKHGQKRVPVVFDNHSGTFGASVADKAFFSKDYKALVAAMSAHLTTLETLEFERWITVDFSLKHESTRRGHGSKEWRGSDHADRPVSGIYLEFDVYDVSKPFDVAVYGGRNATSKSRVWRRLSRIKGEWTPVDGEEARHERDSDDKLIEYTEDRYQTLCGLKESLGKVATVLHAMFDSKALESGAGILLLDKMSGQKLLAAPAPERVVKGRRAR